MKSVINFVSKLLLKLLLIAVGFIVVTFAVYFFNLDMKMTALLEPVLNYFYDRVDRDQNI